jgi:phosphoglycerol transferase
LWRYEVSLYAAIVLVTSAMTTAALELWRSNLAVPFTYSGDAIATGSHFKTVIETGWYEYNPLLGAPYGQTYNDFPTADNLNFVWAKVLGWFIQDWPVAMNLYFLIGFPLAAATVAYLFRIGGLSRGMTLALAPAFALAPYHFYRGEPHLFLASYYIVPLSLVLVLRALQGEPLWGWRANPRRPWHRWFGRGTGTLVIVALTGTTQSYYAVFFLILLAFAGIVNLIRTRGWPRFWGAAIAGGLTALTMLINMAPDIIYGWVNGPNPGGFARGHADSEIYALKLTQLLLPWSGHRIAVLRHFRELYNSSYPNVSENPALGALAASGLVALFLYLCYIVAVGGRLPFGSQSALERARRFSGIGSLVLVMFLFATIGGLSTVISFITTALRGWNRLAIFMSALCLLALGILLDGLLRWAVRKARLGVIPARVAAGGLAVVLLGVAYVDQTPYDAGDGYAPTIAAFEKDSRWFAEVQRAAGSGATVLQLPYQSFPEDTGPTGVLGSEVLIPYLHTTGIAWTGGGIKGRPRSDWPEALATQFAPDEIARLAAAAGMNGIQLDRASLLPRQDLEAGLTARLGNPIRSEDGRYVYYSLSELRATLEDEMGVDELRLVGERVVNPVTLDERESFTREWEDDGSIISVATKPEPRIVVNNDTDGSVETTISLTLGAGPASERVESIDLVLPDGSVRTVDVSSGRGTGRWTVDVPPGLSVISLSTKSADGETIVPLRLYARSAVDPVIADFLSR